ncbi:MAG TPA: M20/M25/M40 family metallo-hydrolase [Longimicrobiaceae bacterium]|nr:M20/M25/M40 family metallo-hydrolase [Longimicrobiaceae bacterium]
MIPRALPLTALASVLSVAAPAQERPALSPQERRIAAHVEAHRAEAVELLERTVNLNSGTLNSEGMRAVYDVLAPELQRLGFAVRYAALPAEMGRGGHLVATLRPRDGRVRGKKLLLIGHLDTVFERDSPFQRFERLNDSIAKGPGVADMKGGNVVIVQALKALASAGALEGAHITVVMTGDEEAPGRPLEAARAVLLEAGREADMALGFEGGSRDGDGTARAVVARRSSSSWRLDVHARPAHSSGIFSGSVGAGAINEASRILDRFYGEIRGEENLTFNVGMILGGTDVAYDQQEARGTAFGKTNVVPETVVATGDIRTLTDEQLQRTRERMRHIVAVGLPHTRAEIAFEDGYPSMPPTPANYELLRLYSNVSEGLGLGPVLPFDPARRGAADVSFVAAHVDAAMDGLGVYGSGSHTVEETVELASLPLQTKRAALLIHRLTR